jgi:hypothetical protein
VVEQRPFKPKVVGSIPTAPTNHYMDRIFIQRTISGKRFQGEWISQI